MNVLKMQDLNLKGKRVLIRVDFNVPISDGRISSDARIKATLPTIQMALDQGAKVMILSHLGRPKEGFFQPEFSLAPVAEYLTRALGIEVSLVLNWLEGIPVTQGECILCENVRFNVGEKANSDELAMKMAQLCDVYVMDAFGSAHRAEASTHAIAKYAPIACAGPLMVAELEALSQALQSPAHPLVAVVGGSKVSTKLTILESLSQKVDQLILGGGIANTFLKAAGFEVGKSLVEADLVDIAKSLMEKTDIPLPSDVVCAKSFSKDAEATIKSIAEVTADDMILDVGPETIARFQELLHSAKTIVWNGPVGVFEFPAFEMGTKMLAHAIADSQAFSLAGGGDTLAAIDQFQCADKISYISTGGGAFLEFLEGKTLPAVEILQARVSRDAKYTQSN